MEPFLITEKRLMDLTATRQGRVSLGGFNFQAAYAVARLASMLVRRPIFDLPDFPIRLRYDWGEDLDERCDNDRVVFTQCKRIANIGQPVGLASVLQSFAAKWLSVPSAQRDNVHFRLVCIDPRFRAGGQLSGIAADLRVDTERHFEKSLGIQPGDRSDRALWQAEADAVGYTQLFVALWERTDVLFLSPDVITGHPAGSLLHAEREALEILLTFSQISPSTQTEALARLRRIVHDNLIAFDPTNDTKADFSNQKPRICERADVANALALCQPTLSGPLPFDVVDRTFLSKQREAPRRQFVARQPDWADVVRGADATIKFVERSVTAEMRAKIITELVEPVERGTERRLRMLFVVGAPGSGKTTLARRATAMLVEEGRIVVADAGVDAHEPAGVPEEYIKSLEQLASAGRPVIFLLDDPLYSDSPWIAIFKKLNRPSLKVAVLAACPQMMFDRYRGNIPIAGVKHFNIGSPTDEERTEMQRLYGRTTDASRNTTEFLVITMEAAAGTSFDEIIGRLWQNLNDGKPIPEEWDSAAWGLRAFMIVCYFHRHYLGCPEPMLHSVLGHSVGTSPSFDISTALARLHAQDGWLIFRFAEHERANWAFQGTQIFAAHQRIAQRAWELRPMEWISIGDKIIQASLALPQTIRQVATLVARSRSSKDESDRSFADHLVAEWISEKHRFSLETRHICDLSRALQMNGHRDIALQMEAQLRARLTGTGDSWLATMQLAFLLGETKGGQIYARNINLSEAIAQADFSIAPNRAGQFFALLPDNLKPAFSMRLLSAFDGELAWGLDASLITWLFHNSRAEMLKRASNIEAWLKEHPDDAYVRTGYLALLSKQALDKVHLDRVTADTEAWLTVHPDNGNVRASYRELLINQGLDKAQLDFRVITDVEAWLKAHPDDVNARQVYLALLSKRGLAKEPLGQVIADTKAWLKAHPDDGNVRASYLAMLSRHVLDKVQLNRVITDTEAWLNAHPDDGNVRAGHLALLSRQMLDKMQLSRTIADTEAWLKVHPNDRNVRSGYLALLSVQKLKKAQLDRVITETKAWLKAHPDNTNVHASYLSLLSNERLDKVQLDRVIADTEAWLKAHPDDTSVRTGFRALLFKQGLDSAQLNYLIAETETWLKAHPDDAHIRADYLAMLSRHVLDKVQLNRVIADTEAWLNAHPDDGNVRHGYLGFLEKKPECGERLWLVLQEIEVWLESHPNNVHTQSRCIALRKLKQVSAVPDSVPKASKPEGFRVRWPGE